MANFIPIAGSPDGAGGYLIQPEYAEPLVDTILRETAIDKVGVRTERTNTRKRIYPRLIGRPTAAFQGEAADGAVTGAEFAKISILVKKISSTIIYTEEELEDAYADPESLLGPEVEKAFALLVDAHALGLSSGVAITSQFTDENGVVQDVNSQVPGAAKIEYGATNDAFALATSAAAAYVEGNGGIVNGWAVASDARQALRDARDGEGRPLYEAFGAIPGVGTPDIPGLSFTSNLDGFPAGAGKVMAIGGDWTHARLVVRSDVTVKVTAEATINDGTTDHRTFQEDEVAVKYTFRAGFGTHQADEMFAEVINVA